MLFPVVYQLQGGIQGVPTDGKVIKEEETTLNTTESEGRIRFGLSKDKVNFFPLSLISVSYAGVR